MENESYYVGIDVGTSSARAGLFDRNGNLIATASQAIDTYKPKPNYVEQSSENIWQAVSYSCRKILSDSNIPSSSVRGIGFDATCSLVSVDERGNPVTVSPTRNDEQNIIVWMDHRAITEVSEVNATEHEVLRYSGGSISPEMQIPKLLWLKKNMPETFSRAAFFFDLPDWLTFRATGNTTRSLCSAVCKWTYQGSSGTTGEGWHPEFFDQLDLAVLSEQSYKRIGNRFLNPGATVGNLTEQAALDLGLTTEVPVAASIIDAYAGALGTIGISIEAHDSP
jgi:FGGY-family pentulose kinase